MDNSFFGRNNTTFANITSDKTQVVQEDIVMKVVFGLIAFLSFFGNLLLCIIIVRRRSMLKKGYNVLIFNLAVTDMLSGIFIVATPDYLIDRKTFPYPSGLAGEIYCRLIGSTYILFLFGKASTSTIMCLAIDRWYSIVKPIQYMTKFSRRRLYLYITAIWIVSCITQVNELFITEVENDLCTFKTPSYGKKIERILILTHVIVTFYLPSIITWGSFAHILYHLRRKTVRRHVNNNKATHRLLRMCALAAFFLSICWLPTETFFVLFKFEVKTLSFTAYLVLGVMAMANSCLNPFIYCLSNKEYSKEFIKLLCCSQSRMPDLRRFIGASYSFSNAVCIDNEAVTERSGLEMRRMSSLPSVFTQISSPPTSTSTSRSVSMTAAQKNSLASIYNK